MVARSALVVGADQPLGGACAVALAALGMGVLVCGKDERVLGEIVGEIAYSGGRSRHRVIEGAVDVGALVAEATKLFGEPCETVGIGEQAAGCDTMVRAIQTRAEADTSATPQRRIFVVGDVDATSLLEVFRAQPGVFVLG
jgi:NAD(P)-dependent dehydrogenase (short-subunit alcohol dehydrogenase family)